MSIVELREYKILPRNRNAFWENYKTNGLPIQTKYLDEPLGFYFVDIGAPYSFVHMWGYPSLSKREIARKQLHQDKGWLDYVTSAHNFIEDINVRILIRKEYPE